MTGDTPIRDLPADLRHRFDVLAEKMSRGTTTCDDAEMLMLLAEYTYTRGKSDEADDLLGLGNNPGLTE